MDSSFWKNKPVIVNNIKNISNILTSQELLYKVNKEIENSKFKLGYNTIEKNEENINNMIEFINENYVISEDDCFQLHYNKELLDYYTQEDCIILKFFPLEKKDTIGYIIGKKCDVFIHDKIYNTTEVNFLCVIPKLRNIGISSYMINALTREIVIKYDINTAHYTISSKINSPFFGEKRYYHRFINIDKLLTTGFLERIDNDSIYNIYKTFNCSKNFESSHNIKYICNELISDSVIEELHYKLIEYCKKTYDIYNYITIENFKKTFTNKSFHHFIIYNSDNKIISYACLFKIDSYNTKIKKFHSVGNYYFMFLNKENIINELEMINKYIYDNNYIFDIISFPDIFDIDYNNLKCIPGSAITRYYFYNMICPSIKNYKNGLVTM